MRFKELEEKNIQVWNAIYKIKRNWSGPKTVMVNGAGGSDSNYWWCIELLSWGGIPVLRYENLKQKTFEFKIVTTRNLVRFIRKPYLENFHRLPRAKGNRKKIKREWEKLNEIVEMADIARENRHNKKKDVCCFLYFCNDATICTRFIDGSILTQIWIENGRLESNYSNYYLIDVLDMLKLLSINDDEECQQKIWGIEYKYMRHPWYSEEPIVHENQYLYENRYFNVGCTIAN